MEEKSLIDLKYFKLPIRIYQMSLEEVARKLEDKINERLRRREEGENMDEEEEEEELNWSMGYIRIPYDMMVRAHWMDAHSKKEEPKKLIEEGYDSTVIILPTGEEHSSIWKREKFEKNFEEFIKNYEEKFGNVK